MEKIGTRFKSLATGCNSFLKNYIPGNKILSELVVNVDVNVTRIANVFDKTTNSVEIVENSVLGIESTLIHLKIGTVGSIQDGTGQLIRTIKEGVAEINNAAIGGLKKRKVKLEHY